MVVINLMVRFVVILMVRLCGNLMVVINFHGEVCGNLMVVINGGN